MSLPNDPPTSKAGSQPSQDWRDELKRRIEAHQLSKEDPLNEAAPSGADSDLQRQSPPARSPSREAPRLPDSENPELPRSEKRSTGGGTNLEAGPFGSSSRHRNDDLRHAEASSQDPFSVQPPFENGEPGTEPGSIERSLDPSEVSGASRRQIVTFSGKATPSTPPLEREFSLSLAGSARAPIPGDSDPADEDFADEDSSAGETNWISREIFLSRLLAGLVDLLLASFAGLIFGWVASSVLGFDFFSAATIQIALATGLLFYWVASLFFLSLCGQTPGMHLTSLQLLYQESTDLPFMAVFIRVIAILPVIATVAGLLWGLFDPWGRCLHDRVSQTRVASVPDQPGSSSSAPLLDEG